MSWPRFIRLCQVEAIPRFDTLRLTFEVRDAGGCDFFAYATALRTGTLVDLQASDHDRAGTTGRGAVVDELIAERVRRRLAHARAGAVIREFDRSRKRRAA